jgi:hypothetical protein
MAVICEMIMIQTLIVLVFLTRVEPFMSPFFKSIIIKHQKINRINDCSNNQVSLANKVSSTAVFMSQPYMEDGVTLKNLLDVQADGKFLKDSIQRWLDEG